MFCPIIRTVSKKTLHIYNNQFSDFRSGLKNMKPREVRFGAWLVPSLYIQQEIQIINPVPDFHIFNIVCHCSGAWNDKNRLPGDEACVMDVTDPGILSIK